MEDNNTLRFEVPLDLIKNQDIYVIGSCDSIGYLKIIGLIVDISKSTREFRITLSDRLSVNDEIELIIPINGYTYLKVNHMAIDIHTGRYIVWGKDFTGN